MKRVGLLLALLVVMGGWMRGQGCDSTGAAWASPGKTPTFLALIIGQDDRLAPATWAKLAERIPTEPLESNGPKALHMLYGGKPEAASQLLAQHVLNLHAGQLRMGVAPDSTISPNGLADLELAGIAALIQGKLADADEQLSLAYKFSDDRLRCRLRTEHLLVQYVAQYGMQAPLFPHFNGGFFNFLQDSLGWKPGATDPQGYVTALNVVTQLYRLDGAHGPLYLELLGDLLSREPNAFNANYLAALAYLRSGQLLGNDQQARMERKALFALEAPHQNEERFNQYRFTQLKKALQEDVDSAMALQAAHADQEAKDLASGTDPLSRFQGWTTSPITVGFEETAPGRLSAMLMRSKAQIAAHEAEAKRYAGDVDLKAEVKKDNRFNTFALFLIGSIIAAAIVIWRKLLVASRSQS